MCLVASCHNGNAKSHQVLGQVLGYMMSHDGVWQATADEIADYYMDNYYDTMVNYVDEFSQDHSALT